MTVPDMKPWDSTLISRGEKQIKLSRVTYLEANLARYVRRSDIDKESVELYLQKYEDVDLALVHPWIRNKALTAVGRKSI